MIIFKNHYMFVGKYILLSSSAFLLKQVLGAWALEVGPRP